MTCSHSLKLEGERDACFLVKFKIKRLRALPSTTSSLLKKLHKIHFFFSFFLDSNSTNQPTNADAKF